MKTSIFFFSIVLASFSITSCKVETKIEPVQKTDISEFTGQWTLDIKGGSVGWLEVRQEVDYLDADLLWIGGSVLPVANIFLAQDKFLIVTRTNNVVLTRDENNVPVRSHVITSWMEIVKDGD
jgi:hypothetical protein